MGGAGYVSARCKGQWCTFGSRTPRRSYKHTRCFEPSLRTVAEILGSRVDRTNIACTAMAAGLEILWVLTAAMVDPAIEGWTYSIERRRDGTRIEQPWHLMRTPSTISGTRWDKNFTCNDLYHICPVSPIVFTFISWISWFNAVLSFISLGSFLCVGQSIRCIKGVPRGNRRGMWAGSLC
jgi:hypothetical protein